MTIMDNAIIDDSIMKNVILRLCFCMFLTNSITAANAVTALNECPSEQHQFKWSGGGAYPQILSHNNQLHLISDVSGTWINDPETSQWQFSNTGLSNLSISSITFSSSHPEIGYVTTNPVITRLSI